MKAFNLNEAKAGKAVCTREGMPARIVCWDLKFGKDNKYTLLALIEDEDGDEMPMSYTSKGRLINNETKNKRDLMMGAEKREGWVNIYAGSYVDSNLNRYFSGIFSTKEEAQKYITGHNIVDCVKIEWEE